MLLGNRLTDADTEIYGKYGNTRNRQTGSYILQEVLFNRKVSVCFHLLSKRVHIFR